MDQLMAIIIAIATALGINLPAGSSAPAPAPRPAATAPAISATQAEDIALRHAGLGRNQVRFDDRTELDYERGQRVWEVSFESGRWEYDYDINATTGKIVTSDKEWD